MEELKVLKDRIEREKQIRRILLFSLGLNVCIYLSTREGSDLIDVDYIR